MNRPIAKPTNKASTQAHRSRPGRANHRAIDRASIRVLRALSVSLRGPIHSGVSNQPPEAIIGAVTACAGTSSRCLPLVALPLIDSLSEALAGKPSMRFIGAKNAWPHWASRVALTPATDWAVLRASMRHYLAHHCGLQAEPHWELHRVLRCGDGQALELARLRRSATQRVDRKLPGTSTAVDSAALSNVWH